jgi:hypothetical protein
MKTKFKFFRGYVGTLDLMDGQTYETASLYYPRLDSNNEMERWFAERDLQTISQEQYNLNRDMLIEQERIRRLGMINHSMETDNQIRLFQATTTVSVNPTPWTKVKIFGTRVKLVLIETWKLEPIGVVVMTLLVSVVTFIGIAKLFGA